MDAFLFPLLRTARLTGLTLGVIASLAVLAGTLPSLLGYDSFVIDGGSMAPSIPDGSIVVAARTPVEELRAGQVITFRPSRESARFVTHRIVKVRPEETIEGVTVTTMGDANGTVDPVDAQLTGAVPRMLFFIPMAGRLLDFLRSPIGTVASIVAPLAFIALSGVRRRAPEDAPSQVSVEPPGPIVVQEGVPDAPPVPVHASPQKPIFVENVVDAAPRRIMLVIENRSTTSGVVFPKADPRLQLTIAPGGWIMLDRDEEDRLLQCGWMTTTPEVRWHTREAVQGVQPVPTTPRYDLPVTTVGAPDVRSRRREVAPRLRLVPPMRRRDATRPRAA